MISNFLLELLLHSSKYNLRDILRGTSYREPPTQTRSGGGYKLLVKFDKILPFASMHMPINTRLPLASLRNSLLRRPNKLCYCTSSSLSAQTTTSSQNLRRHPALAPTQKSITAPLSSSSTAAIIASHRTEAISRHLSLANQTRNMSYGQQNSEYKARRVGAPNTLEYRCYIEKDGVPVSPFHDIPLYANEQQTILNMIVEIPRWTNAKQEVRLFPMFADLY